MIDKATMKRQDLMAMMLTLLTSPLHKVSNCFNSCGKQSQPFWITRNIQLCMSMFVKHSLEYIGSIIRSMQKKTARCNRFSQHCKALHIIITSMHESVDIFNSYTIKISVVLSKEMSFATLRRNGLLVLLRTLCKARDASQVSVRFCSQRAPFIDE